MNRVRDHDQPPLHCHLHAHVRPRGQEQNPLRVVSGQDLVHVAVADPGGRACHRHEEAAAHAVEAGGVRGRERGQVMDLDGGRRDGGRVFNGGRVQVGGAEAAAGEGGRR